MATTVTTSQPSRCGCRFASHPGCTAVKSTAMLSCQYRPKSVRNISGIFLNLCHEELRQFCRQKQAQPCTKVYLGKASSQCISTIYTIFRFPPQFVKFSDKITKHMFRFILCFHEETKYFFVRVKKIFFSSQTEEMTVLQRKKPGKNSQ